MILSILLTLLLMVPLLLSTAFIPYIHRTAHVRVDVLLMILFLFYPVYTLAVILTFFSIVR